MTKCFRAGHVIFYIDENIEKDLMEYQRRLQKSLETMDLFGTVCLYPYKEDKDIEDLYNSKLIPNTQP